MVEKYWCEFCVSPDSLFMSEGTPLKSRYLDSLHMQYSATDGSKNDSRQCWETVNLSACGVDSVVLINVLKDSLFPE